MTKNNLKARSKNRRGGRTAREVSQLTGIPERDLRRYLNLVLLSSQERSAQKKVFSRDELIGLERLAFLQFLGLPYSRVRHCVTHRHSVLTQDLRVQRQILADMREQLDRAMSSLEHAELANRNPASRDWIALCKVIEGINMMRRSKGYDKYLDVISMLNASPEGSS